jgi:hypothetical protein
LEIGDWKMEIGRWRLEDGDWKMEIGRWRLEDGDWKMEIGNWKLEIGEIDPFRRRKTMFGATNSQPA